MSLDRSRPLRVPLHTKRETPRTLDTDRLDDAVRGHRFDAHAVTRAVYALRVEGVHQNLFLADNSLQ